MRDFKFRAWNHKEYKMSKAFTFGNILNFCTEKGLGTIKSLTDEQVMQYTGLKDKNDIEIWEGDIVTHEDFKLPSEVTFERGCFRIHNFTISNFEAIHHMGKIEVIGNIYENKELLNES